MYDALKSALSQTGIPFAEGAWRTAPAPPYAVIALTGGGEALWASDQQQQEAVLGTLDLFCANADRALKHKITQALKSSGVSFRLNSIQHETETRLVHYEWVFELETDDHAEITLSPASRTVRAPMPYYVSVAFDPPYKADYLLEAACSSPAVTFGLITPEEGATSASIYVQPPGTDVSAAITVTYNAGGLLATAEHTLIARYS